MGRFFTTPFCPQFFVCALWGSVVGFDSSGLAGRRAVSGIQERAPVGDRQDLFCSRRRPFVTGALIHGLRVGVGFLTRIRTTLLSGSQKSHGQTQGFRRLFSSFSATASDLYCLLREPGLFSLELAAGG